jgi:hypothetical protein
MGGLNPVANATSYLSVVLCDGSSRKLIAGWWYVLLIYVFSDYHYFLWRHWFYMCTTHEMCLERLFDITVSSFGGWMV